MHCTLRHGERKSNRQGRQLGIDPSARFAEHLLLAKCAHPTGTSRVQVSPKYDSQSLEGMTGNGRRIWRRKDCGFEFFFCSRTESTPGPMPVNTNGWTLAKQITRSDMRKNSTKILGAV